MWPKFKEQIPAVIVTAALVIVAAAVTINRIVRQQRAELEPLRAQNELLRSQSEENRRQIEATVKLMREAVINGEATVSRTEEQVAKMNEERLNRLAQVIAQRVTSELPGPKSPSEIERNERDQVDKVAQRISENIRPVLASAVAEQAGANDALKQSEARAQQLNVGVLAMQSAAQDALRLSQELSTLYFNTYREKGVLTRLVSLPAQVVIDAANLNFVNGDRNKDKIEGEFRAKMDDIDKRVREIRSIASVTGGN